MWTRNYLILKGFRQKRRSSFSNPYPSTVYSQKSNFSSKHHKFAEFRKYIQLEHHFSHNVQVLKTKMVDFKMICTQTKICGLVTI